MLNLASTSDVIRIVTSHAAQIECHASWVDFNGTKGVIAGVVKDFHFRSLHDAIEPLIMYQSPEWTDVFYIKTTVPCSEVFPTYHHF